MRDPECIFCKIAAGENPSSKIYEDGEILAFLDIHPVNPGHALVIPKAHFENLASTPDEIAGKAVAAAKKIGLAIMHATASSGFNLSAANGAAAGQEVMHLHFHVIPRKDRSEHRPWTQRAYAEGEAQKIAADIREKLI